MNMTTKNFIQNRIDNALTRLFYEAKSKNFKNTPSSVCVCTYKNKIVTLAQTDSFDSNLSFVAELECPELTNTPLSFHIDELLKLMSKVLKYELNRELKYVPEKAKLMHVWQFMIRKMPLKCEDYFDNFLHQQLAEIRKSKFYEDVVNDLYENLSNEKCNEFDTSMLIVDVIQSLGYNLSIDERNRIINEIYISDVLS